MENFIIKDEKGQKKLDIHGIIQAAIDEGVEVPPLVFIQHNYMEWDIFQDGEKRYPRGVDIRAERYAPLEYDLKHIGTVTNPETRKEHKMPL